MSDFNEVESVVRRDAFELMVATSRDAFVPERLDALAGLVSVVEVHHSDEAQYVGLYVSALNCPGYAYRHNIRRGLMQVPPRTFFANDIGSTEPADNYTEEFLAHLRATNRTI